MKILRYIWDFFFFIFVMLIGLLGGAIVVPLRAIEDASYKIERWIAEKIFGNHHGS